MADNVPITPGSGADIATDQVTGTGEQIQLMKLAISTDGSRTLIPANGTDGLSVKLTNASVPVGDGTNVVTIDTDPADSEPNSGNALHVEGRTYLYNGSTWDRARGNISNGMLVDVSRVQGQVQVGDGTNAVSVDTAGTDAETNAVNQLHTQARLYGFNGTTWDRIRSTALTFKANQYTSAQTGTALWTPASTKAVVITSLQIQSGGTTAGTCILWFGASGDTTYTRGTDAAVFDGEFAPTATNKPGVIMTLPTPIRGTADYVLRVTTTNAQTVTFTVWGYEI
jgi:hypothetical protein